jgi:hypothetical protein
VDVSLNDWVGLGLEKVRRCRCARRHGTSAAGAGGSVLLRGGVRFGWSSLPAWVPNATVSVQLQNSRCPEWPRSSISHRVSLMS